MQDPQEYLTKLGAVLPCAVHPEKAAVLDVDHRIFVNWEAYFVSSAEARAAFLDAPWRFTGPVTDPVTRVRFVPDQASPRQDYNDRTFYFPDPESRDRFAADPDSYATPMIGMMEKPSGGR